MKRRKRKRPEPKVALMGTKDEWLQLGKKLRAWVETKGVARLVRLREAIVTDAGLPMPPIRIKPYGLLAPGRVGPIYGCIELVTIDNHFQFCAIVPVSTILVVDDDSLLRRILCHEFSHCFWWIQRCLAAEKGGKAVIKGDITELDPTKALERQSAKDSQELIVPSEWFGDWDSENFIFESENNPLFNKFTKKFSEKCQEFGLPIRTHDMTFGADGTFGYEEKIVEHIRSLEKKR